MSDSKTDEERRLLYHLGVCTGLIHRLLETPAIEASGDEDAKRSQLARISNDITTLVHWFYSSSDVKEGSDE